MTLRAAGAESSPPVLPLFSSSTATAIFGSLLTIANPENQEADGSDLPFADW